MVPISGAARLARGTPRARVMETGKGTEDDQVVAQRSAVRGHVIGNVASLGENGAAALVYTVRGWPVFPVYGVNEERCTCGNHPCPGAGKHPRIKEWQKKATTDENLIREWFARWPDANVAILTGERSGLVVLDVDPRSGGEDTLEKLEVRSGKLPETVVSLTGGGGQHIFFRHPGGYIKTKPGAFGPGLDLKADGGYVIAPPSCHKSGRPYAWDLEFHPEDVGLADFPCWMLQSINGNRQRYAEGPTNSVSPSPRTPPTSRHRGLLLQTMRDRSRYPQEETLSRALETADQMGLLAEGRRKEVVRMVEGAYAKPPFIEGLHPTDLGNARRLIRDHADRIRYCHTWDRWLVWDGNHWKRDDTGEIYRRAERTVALLLEEAAGLEDKDARKKLAGHAIKSESERSMRAMISLAARLDERVAITHEVLDIDPWLLNVENGTLDLRTCQLREHRTEDMLTHCLDVAYDPQAKCPRWLNFLARVFDNDDDLIEFVSRAAGYSLTGSTREQVFFLLYGTGANGKTTFLESIQDLLGNLAQSARFDSFLVKRSDAIPNDIARMCGARFVTAIEAEVGRRLSESVIKQLTGQDTVTARFMRGEFFDFQPAFKLWLASNHKPVIRGTDLAIWRRVRLIPFQVSIPEDEQDPDLAGKLREELPGILAWAVEGCRQWRDRGLGTCPAVAAYTNAYRQEQDTLKQFLEDECEIGSGSEVTKSQLYERYRTWAESNGDNPMSHKRLSMQLQERPDGICEVRRHRGERWWIGLGLRTHCTPGDR